MLYKRIGKFRGFLVILIALAGIFPQGSFAVTLHAILVADTSDKDIGRSTMTDLSNMSNLMESINENTGLTLNVKRIQGSTLTSGIGYNAVTQAVENLSGVGQQDIVIFYYSGHGGRMSSDKSRWPSLGVEGKRTGQSRMLPLKWVVDKLKQKRPRFFIAIADSCNSLMDTGRFIPRPVGNKNAYQKLFLGYKGYIIASGSRPKEFAFGDPQLGGLFSQTLHATLNKEFATSNPRSWKAIMKDATQPIQTGSSIQSVQHPQAMVKADPIEFEPVADENLPDACPDDSCAGSIELDPCDGRGTCQTGDYFPKGELECCCDDSGKLECYE